MRVVHVYKNYHPTPGGIETQLRALATGQAARGVEVVVLVVNHRPGGERGTDQGAEVVRCPPTGRVSTAPFSLAMFSALRRSRPDVVHLHSPYPPGELMQWLMRQGRTTVVSYHSDIVRPSQRRLLRVYGPVFRDLLRHAGAIAVSSPALVQTSPFLAPVASRCRIIPYGIDTDRFDPSRTAAAAQRLRSRYGGPLVLFVGQFRYYKGVEHAIEALTMAPGVLVLVGRGEREQAWRARATELGVAERVRFAGEVTDEELPAFYAAADVLVLPASQRAETFGIAQVEAMASGLPVICTEVGTGTSYVTQHGQTGLVVPPCDPRALADALRRLLSDEPLRRAMGERGRLRARQEFASEIMVGRMLDLYQEALAGA